MACWLVKTEPGTYSFEDLMREGRTVWDGVTNPLAQRNMRGMRSGDEVFVYHTGSEKRIVGLADVVSDPYPAPRSVASGLVVVDLAPKRSLASPVSLADLKSRREFDSFDLVRLPRLSVMPVPAGIRAAILRLSR